MIEHILFMSLATFWLSYMLVSTNGPYDIFKWLRDALNDVRWTNLDCIYCTTMQVSLVLNLLWSWHSQDWALLPYLLWSLAVAGVAVLWADLMMFLEGEQKSPSEVSNINQKK